MEATADQIEEYRHAAREWLEATFERREPVESGRFIVESKTPQDIAEAKVRQRKLFDAGFAGITFPIDYGGQGLTPEHERAFNAEAIRFEGPDFGGVGHVSFGAIARSMLAHASPEFLARHIPRILSGEELWCQFYSEPEAGSDLAGIRTRATRDGDRWILSGSKIWSTGAHLADWAMCLARTDWDVSKHRGLTWFGIPTDAHGLVIQPIMQINGSAEFCEEFLDDVVVGDDEVIGEVDDGWSVARTMLIHERGGGEFASIPTEPRELSPHLVSLARRAGRIDDPVARQEIARSHIYDFASFHLGRRMVTRILSSANPDPAVAAYAKLAMGVLQPERARIAIQIAGPAALGWDPAEPGGDATAIEYLNGRMTSIAAGTNEVQRNGIGERVLGLPREPSFDLTKPFAEVVRDAQNWDGRVS